MKPATFLFLLGQGSVFVVKAREQFLLYKNSSKHQTNLTADREENVKME